MQNTKSCTAIIAKYHAMLERYARRFMVNKLMACTVVNESFEKLYVQGRLIDGPQLRQALQTTIRECWHEVDASMARAEQALGNSFQEKF